MKLRPILFSTPMVRAILEGRKTMTRRVVKPQNSRGYILQNGNTHFYLVGTTPMEFIKCPYGTIGDRLWVREKLIKTNDGATYYFASAPDNFKKLPHWNYDKIVPSIHMKREECRILLEIVNVRVERLQEITGGEADKEGVVWKDNHADEMPEGNKLLRSRRAFIELWESINGKESWTENPWVWVIEFKRM